MVVWEGIVAIVTIISISSMVEHWMKQKRLIAEARAEEAKAAGGGLSGQVPHLLAEIDRLKERVAVLEKVVTDPTHRLAAEIDSLRLEDQRADRPSA